MGPGYFPLVLAGALAALGVAIVAKGVTAAAAETPIGPVPWRGAILILAALVFFGATVRGLGLVLRRSSAPPSSARWRAGSNAAGRRAADRRLPDRSPAC